MSNVWRKGILGDKKPLKKGYCYQIVNPSTYGKYVKIWFGGAVIDRALTVQKARERVDRILARKEHDKAKS